MHLVKRIARASIWAPGAIPLDEAKYGNLKRVLLPWIDVCLALSGYSAIRYGAPSLEVFYSHGVMDAFGVLFLGASVMAFLGVAFPALFGLEIGGKLVLLSMSVAYCAALIIVGSEAAENTRGFITGYVGALSGVILWRLTFLGNERQTRRLARAAHKKGH